MRPISTLRLASAIAALATICAPAMAQNIMGPAQITPTSTITNGNPTFPLAQIADGVSADIAPFNGFQGANNMTGTISFTLDKAYDLSKFHLWNDINVRAEGLGNYTLNFYDASNALVGTSGPQTTVPGQVAPYQITFPLMSNVKRVDLVVNSVQSVANTFAKRVEIREVAFTGEPTPPNPDVAGDHFQCYNIARGPVLKPENIVVRDQFGKAEIVLGVPLMLCNPSMKDHNGKTYRIEDKKRHLVCYAVVKQSDQQTTRRVKVANQFTTAEMTVDKRVSFCVPSYKTLIGGKEVSLD